MPALEPVVLREQPALGRSGAIRGALSLSLCTGRPFDWESQRELTSTDVAFIRAAQTIGDAEVSGAQLGSPRLQFQPRGLRAGDYLFDVGAGGSVSLLLQTLGIPLSLAAAESVLKLRGGTHLGSAPSFHYLSLAWGPLLRPLGFSVRAELERAGFPGDGGGEVTARVSPHSEGKGFNRPSRGNLLESGVHSLLAQGSPATAQRQSERARRRLREGGIAADAENVPLTTRGKGTACLITGTFEHSRVCFCAVGLASEEPEAVADRAADQLIRFMSTRGVVDEFMADQLVAPLSLIAAGLLGQAQSSRFTTARLTPALREQLYLVQAFLPVRAVARGEEGGEAEVIIAPPPAVASDL